MHQLSPQISAIVDLCACMKAYLQPSHCEFRSRFDAKHTAIGCLVEGIWWRLNQPQGPQDAPGPRMPQAFLLDSVQ